MRTSLTGALWSPVDVDPDRISRVAGESGLSDVAARCLAIRVAEDAPVGPDGWLAPSLDHLHDPFAMRGMDAAVDRLERALAERQRVRIITDYDVDGTTSSLILQAALRLRDRDVRLDYHIPDRFDEGYGFSVRAADTAADDGVDLIVTADIGVRDHAAVTRARERGVDVLVCDHHLPAGEAVPEDAVVLCPPQEGCTYPNRHLAACGVSLKLAHALLADQDRWPTLLRSLLKLAAIGTVADLVPLTTLENRAIVAVGLDELNRGRHNQGLQALLDASGLERGRIRESDLGFRVGPRINAAGRLADARLVVELLNSRDPARSRALAGELDRLNKERQAVQRRLVAQVLDQLSDPPDPFVVVAGPEDDGWHRGVVGIVASRVKDEVHRPVAVVSVQGDRAVGSVRSVSGIHAVEALSSADDLLVKYGGHPAAAGFTVPTEHLDALRERLCAYVAAHASDADLVPTRTVDAHVPADALGDPLFHELSRLGPFGMGNPRPRLVVPGVQARDVQLRASGRLLRFTLGRGVEAVWWDGAAHTGVVEGGPVDLLGSLGENVWRGRRTLQFQVKDARPAE